MHVVTNVRESSSLQETTAATTRVETKAATAGAAPTTVITESNVADASGGDKNANGANTPAPAANTESATTEYSANGGAISDTEVGEGDDRKEALRARMAQLSGGMGMVYIS